MKDCTGKELKYGDKVAITASRGYANLEITEVIGFTPQKVRVSHQGGVLRDSCQIAILERNPVREEELKPKAKDPNAHQDI